MWTARPRKFIKSPGDGSWEAKQAQRRSPTQRTRVQKYVKRETGYHRRGLRRRGGANQRWDGRVLAIASNFGTKRRRRAEKGYRQT